MTRTLTAVALLLSSTLYVSAQVKAPRPSPSAEMEQTVGHTEIEIEYSRPGKKGRTIFGDLVPYGKLWRTGANMASTIEFNTDITFGGKEVDAGKYALYTIPGEKTWEVFLYNDWKIGGTPDEWEESKIAAKATVNVQKRGTALESFRISVENVKNASAELMIEWDMTAVAVPITVPTDDITMKSIERTMAGPSSRDYASAAAYYLDEKKDMAQAYEWMKKALEMRDDNPYWLLRRKALIEAELGKKEAAIATAKKSLDAAKEAGNMDYVRMNEKSIAEWSK